MKDVFKKQAIELSIKNRVLCPFTSLLVLETEQDYARFGIERRALADVLTVGAGGIELLHRTDTATAIATSPVEGGADDEAESADARPVARTGHQRRRKARTIGRSCRRALRSRRRRSAPSGRRSPRDRLMAKEEAPPIATAAKSPGTRPRRRRRAAAPAVGAGGRAAAARRRPGSRDARVSDDPLSGHRRRRRPVGERPPAPGDARADRVRRRPGARAGDAAGARARRAAHGERDAGSVGAADRRRAARGRRPDPPPQLRRGAGQGARLARAGSRRRAGAGRARRVRRGLGRSDARGARLRIDHRSLPRRAPTCAASPASASSACTARRRWRWRSTPIARRSSSGRITRRAIACSPSRC